MHDLGKYRGRGDNACMQCTYNFGGTDGRCQELAWASANIIWASYIYSICNAVRGVAEG
jgi:hypothetical protein